MEVIYKSELIGVTLSSDLSWSPHINDITKRATKKLWVILRFKALGGTREQLLSVYQLRIRSTLEFAVPVFHSSMTQDQCRQVEMVQQKAFAIILGLGYRSYEFALETLKQDRFDSRCESSSLNFALKCSKSPRHNSVFQQNTNIRENMKYLKKSQEHHCRTSRYYKSSVPYMARLLNKHVNQ